MALNERRNELYYHLKRIESLCSVCEKGDITKLKYYLEKQQYQKIINNCVQYYLFLSLHISRIKYNN